MVNYTDRPGSYKYDAARPDVRFNPKLMKLSLKAIPIIMIFNLLHHKYNGIIKNIVESLPYWEQQVIYT